MKGDFVAKRIKISFPDEKSIDMIEDLVKKSSTISSTEKLAVQTIQEFTPKPVKIRFRKIERSKISLHKEKPMAPIKTIEDFAKKRGKISFPDEKKSIEKMEDINKDLESNFNVDFTCHICFQKGMANKDELVEHVITVHGDHSKVEQKSFREEITMDESSNSLKLFLSDGEQTED